MRRATVRFIALQLTLVVAVGVGLWLSFPGWRLGLISDRLRREYRDLPFITTAELHAWLGPQKEVRPLLLDVRSPAEFEVSHLVGAHRVTAEGDLNPEELPEDRRWTMVVYCSTGERSAAYARRLQRAGFKNVFVLEGAIVRWANEGRPMADARGLVTRVQPGDGKTAPLLKGSHRAAIPATP